MSAWMIGWELEALVQSRAKNKKPVQIVANKCMHAAVTSEYFMSVERK